MHLKNKKWLWAIPIVLIVIVAVVVGGGQLQKGALVLRNPKYLTPYRQMVKAPALPNLQVGQVVLFNANVSPYVRITNYVPVPVVDAFNSTITYYCFGKPQTQTFTINGGIPARGFVDFKDFDPNKTCKTDTVKIDVDVGNIIPEGNEKDNSFTTPTLAQCTEYKRWLDNGVLTPNLGSNWKGFNFCQDNYPGIFYMPSDAQCKQFYDWYKQGVLTNNVGKDFSGVAACQKKLPFVTQGSCAQLKLWLWQGVLTQNVGGNLAEARACSVYLPQYWNAPIPTSAQCKQFFDWNQQGMLTKNVGGDFTGVLICQTWYPYVTQNRCVQLKQWLDQGVLTKNLGPDPGKNGFYAEPMACALYYPNIYP